jgi:hypothetical protein
MNRVISIVLALGVAGCSAESSNPGGTPIPVNMPPANTAGSVAPPPATTAGSAAPTNPTPMAGSSAPIDPMPTAGTTGSAAGAGGVGGGAGGAGGTGGTMTPGIAMDECGLDTMYPGDEYCIKPPPEAEGFQMHIGPSNHANPESRFVLEPGQEVNESFSATSGNTEMKYYYYRQYRMRPGTHHLIVNSGIARRLGGSTSSAKDNPQSGIIAPENMDVGMPIGPRTQLSNSLHYYNFTQKPILKEVWVNFWYRDPAVVKRAASEVFSFAPMRVSPGEHVLIKGSCRVSGTGHALTLYPHVHANNNRFAAYRVRGGQRETILESFDWEHPYLAEYSSLVTNPKSDRAAKTAGGFSGVLELTPSDMIDFECDVTNNTNSIFVGANEAKDDEMCILVGDTVGASISPACSYTTERL